MFNNTDTHTNIQACLHSYIQPLGFFVVCFVLETKLCYWSVELLNTVGSFNPTTGILLLWQQLANSNSLKFHKYAKHQIVHTTFVTLSSPTDDETSCKLSGVIPLQRSSAHFVLLQDRQIETFFFHFLSLFTSICGSCWSALMITVLIKMRWLVKSERPKTDERLTAQIPETRQCGTGREGGSHSKGEKERQRNTEMHRFSGRPLSPVPTLFLPHHAHAVLTSPCDFSHSLNHHLALSPYL